MGNLIMKSLRSYILNRMTLLCLMGIIISTFVVAGETTPPPAQKMKQSLGKWTYPMEGKQQEGPFIFFTPPAWDGNTPIPMLIFLHGAGYRGNDISKLDQDEILKQIRAGRVFDAIVVCPQVGSYWAGEQAAVFIDQALEKFAGKFDPDRVYLTGESSGGGGTWEGAKLRAGVLAAAVPIATTLGKKEGAEKLVNLPIWAFHNIHDPYQVVEKSRIQVKAVKDAGGKYVFLTEYTVTAGKEKDGIWPNTHKQSWEAAYNYKPMWDWLFRQRRGKPDLSLDPPPQIQVPENKQKPD